MADRVIGPEDIVINEYSGELGQLLPEDDEQASLETIKTASLARSIYNAGTPIYSKEKIQDVLTQLQTNSSEIRITAIDGRSWSFRRQTGETYDASVDSSEYEWYIDTPFIRFFSIQDILVHCREYPAPLSLCSMWIHHDLFKRSKTTGELQCPVPDQSQLEVAQFFQSNRESWEASEQCRQLRMTLSSVANSKITKIIAFACGGMAFSNRIPWATRSAYQHALILTVKEVLIARKDQPGKIECYVQDPVYCDLDRDVLAMHEIRILDSPRGFLELDESCVILSFGADIAVRQIVADITCPAVMIWDRSLHRTDELEGPLLLDFPGDLDAFKDTAIYAREHDNFGSPTEWQTTIVSQFETVGANHQYLPVT